MIRVMDPSITFAVGVIFAVGIKLSYMLGRKNALLEIERLFRH